MEGHTAAVDQGDLFGRSVEQIDLVAFAGEGESEGQADVSAAADDGERSVGQVVGSFGLHRASRGSREGFE